MTLLAREGHPPIQGSASTLIPGGDDIFRNIRVQYPGSLSYLTTLYYTTNLGYCGGACTVTDAVIPHYEVSARNQYSAGSIYAANFYGALNTPSGTFAPSLPWWSVHWNDGHIQRILSHRRVVGLCAAFLSS